MPRGRPRKIPLEPITEDTKDTLAWGIAEQLSVYCGVRGCIPKIHLDDANKIVEKLRVRYPQYIKEQVI